MTTLEILHHKVRELGGEIVRKMFPTTHHNKFNQICGGGTPIPPNIEEKILATWPELIEASSQATKEVSEDTERVAPLLGANQLNFTILMPVRNTYDPSTVNSLVGLIRRTGCGWIQRPFDSMIARSRNILAAAFLKSDFEYSLWLDDDMVIPNGEPDWFKRTINIKPPISDEYAGIMAPYQLASWGKKLVSAVYFSRHGVPQITAGFPSGTSLKNRLPSRTLLPATYCGFGCVMVHRSVYEDILKIHPELWDGKAQECQVFSTFQNGDRMVGEDEAMCIRANEAGHPTFLDMSVVCGHIGRSVNYIPQNL